jgi:hypothetical protein
MNSITPVSSAYTNYYTQTTGIPTRKRKVNFYRNKDLYITNLFNNDLLYLNNALIKIKDLRLYKTPSDVLEAIKSGNIIIKNEDDAITVLKYAINNEITNNKLNIDFQGWPSLSIEYKGKGYNGTITPEIANAILDLQNALNRTFCLFVYGKNDARLLKKQNRVETNLKVKIRQGSTFSEWLGLDNFFKKLAEGIINMPPKYFVITVLGCALITGIYFAYAHYNDNQKEIELARISKERDVELSKTELEKQKVLADAISIIPQLKNVSENIGKAKQSLQDSKGNADSMFINSKKIQHHP